ncbi:MAG: RNA polymerase sigma-70 factor [Bacteroidota bacterium]
MRIDTEADFRKLYEEYFPRLYSYALQSTHNGGTAEDLVQNIFLKIWERRAQFDDSLPIEAQIFKITRDQTIDFYRAETTLQQHLAGYRAQANSEEIVEEEESDQRVKLVKEAIADLPDKRREVLELSRFHGLTHEEIAQELSISKNTVRVHITKAMASLRARLATWLLF